MDVADRDAIMKLAERPARVELVEIPAWGKSVYVREVSAGERDHIEALKQLATTRPAAIRSGVRAQFCAYFLSDAEGRRLFQNSASDLGVLDAMPHPGLDQVFDAGIALNEFGPADEESAEKK